MATSDTTDIYDTQAAAQRQAERQAAETQSDATLLNSRANQDYRFTRSTLDRALQKGISTISDDFASRGMYMSGIRRQQQADLATGYVEDTGAADQALQRQLEDISRASTKGMLGIETGLEGSLFDSTNGGLNGVLQRALNDAKGLNSG